MPQLTVLQKACQDRSETLVRDIVAVENEFLNERLLCRLLNQILVQCHAVTFIERVALQVEHVTTDLRVDGERHDFLIIAVLHIVDVGVIGCVMSN